jgi:uncharacterized protein YjiS (DUF1127 family)
LSDTLSHKAKTGAVQRGSTRLNFFSEDCSSLALELAMSRIYVATVVAAFVTTSLATNLLVVGVRGPVQSEFVVRLRCRARRLRRLLGRAVDAWVVSMLASRERQATFYALRQLSDRELRDVGLCRGSHGHIRALCPDDGRASPPFEEGRLR